MTSGLLPAKWNGIMPGLQEKAYHSAFFGTWRTLNSPSAVLAALVYQSPPPASSNKMESEAKFFAVNLSLTMKNGDVYYAKGSPIRPMTPS
jgi:hypothetical protein